jgi:5-oxoprolinase (ATP-hydrolysing) subunit C
VLEVREPGLLTTVQDGRGRPDAAPLGVPRGGAADPDGLAVANLLVGNDADAAALEITMTGPELIVREPCVIGLGGAELGASAVRAGISHPLRAGASHRLQRNDLVRFEGTEAGAGIRAYIALPGGIDVPEVLGSAATCIPGGFGGLDGRALRSGDVIAGRNRDSDIGVTTWPNVVLKTQNRGVVRVTPGPHATQPSLGALCDAPWTVSPTSSRAGIRLTGRSMDGGLGRLTSLPMMWGAVQLPPDGEPIVLLVDAPTVGGYPVIAVVASVDRGVSGQLGAGDAVRFIVVSHENARAAELTRRERLSEAAAKIASAGFGRG